MLPHSWAHILPRRCAGIHSVGPLGYRPVFLNQFEADVCVELLVERLKLLPRALELIGEFLVRHIVAGAPECACVGYSELARALIRELYKARVFGTHGSTDECQ